MRTLSIALTLLALLAPSIAFAIDEAHKQPRIAIYPNQIDLTGRANEQTLTVQRIIDDHTIGTNVTDSVKWSVDDPSIATVEFSEANSPRLIARGNGNTTLTASWTDPNGIQTSATASITTHAVDRDQDVEFTNHVLAIMARNGCNSGACHGALAGKGGFRLSLRGFDPTSDHFNITRQDRARRIERTQSESSLFLTKPSGIVEHKGGLRLPESSNEYQLLVRWIKDGAAGPRATDPKLHHLEMLPGPTIRLAINEMQPLIVRAHYDNGRIEDVTRWSKFNSSDESIATVDEFGRTKIVGPGEGAITAWFASRIIAVRIQVPFPSFASSTASQSMPIANRIDEHVSNQLRSLNLSPSERCSDAEFIRRSTLDATGSLPTEQQVREFLSDPSLDKRSRWIESLLASPEYVDYWTYRWSDVLTLNSNLLRADGVRAYYQWIRSKVETNTPWDQFVREILTARGEALENGATNFYAINQDPEGMTENACQAFLGLSIGCAKCHNHPLEKWTNDQYYAMANLFARVRAKGWGGDVRDGDAVRTLVVVERGDLIQPLKGKPQPPAPLDAQPLDMESTTDRRIYLADWMTSPDNPYFTRAIVNRVWAAYFGIGIVNSVDDMRASNPESNPDLMRALCNDLIANKYDLKSLMRQIMNSEAYQRSSVTNESNRADRKYFSHYYPKRLMAEVLHDAIANIAEIPTTFDKIAFTGGDKRDTKFYNKGTKAIQLFDASVDNNFLKTFGRNQRRITCECERSDEPSIIQVLNLNNGDTLNTKLASSGSIVDELLQTYGDRYHELVEAAFIRCLCRFPTEVEQQSLVKELQSTSDADRHVVLEDMMWSIMTSREFLFNH